MLKKQEINDILSSFVKILNNGEYTFDEAILKLPSDHIIHEFVQFCFLSIDNAKPNANIQNIQISTIKGYNTREQKEDFSVYIIEGKNKKHSFLINDDSLGDFYYELQTVMFKEHLEYIGRKTPKITKSLIDAGYTKYTTDQLTNYYNEIINLKSHIKGKTCSEVYSLLKNEDLKSKMIKIFAGKSEDFCDVNFLIKNLSHEKMTDLCMHLDEERELSSLIKNVTSDKSRDLFSKKSIEYIREIIRLNITESEFRKDFSNKISKYKTKQDLEFSLKKYLEIQSGWHIEPWKSKLDSIQLSTKEIDNHIHLIEVETYEQLQKIGSTQWCIATDPYYFNKYTSNYQRQFMILNFNIPSEDVTSMVGITVDTKGHIIFAHNKNDEDIISSKLIKEYSSVFQKIDEDKLVNKINESVGIDNLFDLYCEYSQFGLNGKAMEDIKEKVILKLLNDESFKTEELFYLHTKTNNISETFSFLYDALTKENFINAVSKIHTGQLALYISGDKSGFTKSLFLNDAFSNSSDHSWFIMSYLNNKHNTEMFDDILDKLYLKDEAVFWKNIDKIGTPIEIGDYFFKNLKIFENFKNKNIPIDLAKIGILINFNEPHVKSYLETLNKKNKNTVLEFFLETNNLHQASELISDIDISKNQVHKHLLTLINDDSYKAYLRELKSVDQDNIIYDAVIDAVIDNIDIIENSDKKLDHIINHQKTRRSLLENDMLKSHQYTIFAINEGVLDKKGIPLIIQSLTDRYSGFNSPYMDTDYELEIIIERALNDNIMTKRELKDEFKKNTHRIPDSIRDLISVNAHKPY
jgi:hypothetical protein